MTNQLDLFSNGNRPDYGWYNTTNKSGNDLIKANAKAQSQQEIILAYFEKHKAVIMTPFDVQREVLQNAPITSVRRAITNLTKSGKLTMLDEKKVEQYGEKNHYWKLNINN